MNEITGINDLVSVSVQRAFKIEPWMLIVFLALFLLYREWKAGNLKI
jgi:hypothetical protein